MKMIFKNKKAQEKKTYEKWIEYAIWIFIFILLLFAVGLLLKKVTGR